MTRKRVVKHAGAAWIAAVAGAWLVAASCRTMQGGAPAHAGSASSAAPASPAVPPPVLRVGILPDVDGVSIGARSGVTVRGRGPGESAMRVRWLDRATFRPGAAAGTLRLGETGDELVLATVAPSAPAEILQADATPYRGLFEVRPSVAGRLTVVNLVNLEDYLRGVVPNELSPEAFPQIEALKAQAVAARTYALAHLGDYGAKGYDVCATAFCQVYRGMSSEHPLTDRAVLETQGTLATWRGRPIHAYYTSTCGGHTEDGAPIFEDGAPYLRGVACPPEASSRRSIRTTAAPRRNLPGGPETARDVGLLEALQVIDAKEAEASRLRGIPSDAEVLAWTARLQSALGVSGCESPVRGALARRASFARHVVASACWSERAERLLASADGERVLALDGAAGLDAEGERPAVALLVHLGLLSPSPGEGLRPDAALTRAEALALLAGVAERGAARALADGEVAGLAEGKLSVLHGEAADSHPIDAAVRLFRDVGGVHAGAWELDLSVGDRVVYVERGGRVVYLEAEAARPGADDGGSPRYRWEVRLTPVDVERTIARYGRVGRVLDIVPTRLGVSGRVVELRVHGSEGLLDLKGLRVRWGLGLRENLFAVRREKGARGEVERFVIAGKGWGHGVGLCQVGAFGMAQAGSTFDEILKHYYTGVRLAGPGTPGRS